MKRIFYVSAALFMILFLLISRPAISQDRIHSLKGSWAGTLKVQSIELRLVINFSFSKSDSLIVTLDSPDQGAKDIPTSKVVIADDSVKISVKSIGGKFTGKYITGDTLINGTWKQGGSAFPLLLIKQAKPLTMNRPQEPKPPFPYRTEEVTFPNPSGGFDLAGTLTIPEKEGRYPVAILVTGSGPQNRDEELFSHKPFMVLADHLTRQGIAVLRYDDRGVGKSGGVFKNATSFDFAGDASSAVDFLKKRADIDTTKIGIIGHSEGGIIAPIVASQRKDVAFIVLMAGTGLTGEQILYLQTNLISKAMNMDERVISANEKLSRDLYAVIKKNSVDSLAAKKMRKLFADFEKKHKKDSAFGHPSPEGIDIQIKSMTSPWFRCFLVTDPQDYLSKVTCPVLAINGSLDLQVPSKENLPAIEKALIFGGNSKYTTEELPGLNHLFQEATTGGPDEYGRIEQTISPSALQMISGWIRNNLR